MMRRSKYILAIPPLVSLAIVYFIGSRSAGMPIDDAYIFERYARNVASGAGYCFNAGEVGFGVTSFLWTILNAFFIKISPTLSFAMISKSLSIVSLVAMIALVELWIYKETENIFLAAAGAIFCSLHPMIFMNAASGMESLFFATLLVGFAYVYRFYSMRRPLLLGLFAGLVYISRPEGLYVLLGVCSIEIYFSLREKKYGDLKKLLFFICGFALFALPLEIYIGVHTGNWLPTTYYGKMTAAIGCGRPGIFIKIIDAAMYMLKGHARTITYFGWAGGLVWAGALLFTMEVFSRALTLTDTEIDIKPKESSWVMVMINAVLLAELWRTALGSFFKAFFALSIIPYLFVNFVVRIKEKRGELQSGDRRTTGGFLLLAGLLFFPAAYGLFFKAGPIFGGYYNRYIVVIVPTIVILATKTFYSFSRSYSKRTITVIAALVICYSAAITIWWIPENRELYENEIYLNENLRMSAANWLNENTPKDAVVMVGYTGLGVVGGRSDRKILDLGALINPDIAEYYKNMPCGLEKKWPGTVAYMKAHNVTYFVTVPGKNGDPNSNPVGEPGFLLAKKITDRSIKMEFNEIDIWKIDFE